MNYIKRKRDRRDYELRQALNRHFVQIPRQMLEANRKAIEDELAFNMPVWGKR